MRSARRAGTAGSLLRGSRGAADNEYEGGRELADLAAHVTTGAKCAIVLSKK
jgi:hypothetical protein